MASSDLTWTEAESPVNQIEEYRIFRSVSVLVDDPAFADSFVLFETLPVVRDPEFPFDEVHPTSFSDTAVDFGTDTYCYRVDSVSVLVGEATGGSPQTGVGPSNIICLGTQPSAVVLSGVCSGDNVELDWTASTPALNTIAFYTICRSVNGGAFEDIATVAEPGLSFIDTTADCTNNILDYIVKVTDEAGIVSDDSNTLSFGFTEEYFICCADGLAASQRVMTSADGLTWTPQTIADDAYEGLAWAPDLGHVTNGRLVVMSRGGDQNIKTSDDAGVTWIQRTSAAAGLSGFNSLDYSETLGLFAAVSNNATSNGNKIMTSADGITWALQTTPAGADNKSWASIRWIDAYGLFVCAGIAGHAMRSSDGITWIYQDTAGVSMDQQDTTSGGLTVFSNPGDISNMFTNDGINYTEVPNPPGNDWNGGMRACGAIGGAIIVLAGGTQGSWSTGNGSSWSGPSDIPASHDLASFNAMVFGSEAGLMVAVGSGNGADNIVTSPNGSSWGGVTAPIIGSWDEIIVATRSTQNLLQELVMVEDSTGPNEAVQSVDGGSNWSVNDTTSGDGFEDVAYSPTLGLFAAVAPFGDVFTSPDGITWTLRTRANASPWVTLTWSADLGLFIKGASDSGVIMIGTSSDGLVWTTRTTPSSSIIHDVVAATSGGNAIAVGRNGATAPTGNVLHSTDGTTWAAPSGAHASNTCAACAYDSTRGRFVVVQIDGACNVSTTGADSWSLNINTFDLTSGWTPDLCNMEYSAALDLLIMVGNLGLYTSGDGGVTWVLRDGQDFRDVVWSDTNGKFYVCNDVIPRLKSSVDGLDWVTHADPGGITGTWTGIALGAIN